MEVRLWHEFVRYVSLADVRHYHHGKSIANDVFVVANSIGRFAGSAGFYVDDSRNTFSRIRTSQGRVEVQDTGALATCLVRGADHSIKPGAKRSATPETRSSENIRSPRRGRQWIANDVAWSSAAVARSAGSEYFWRSPTFAYYSLGANGHRTKGSRGQVSSALDTQERCLLARTAGTKNRSQQSVAKRAGRCLLP